MNGDPMSSLDRFRVTVLASPLLRYMSVPGLRGKGILLRSVLPAILPSRPASFRLVRPGGTTVRLQYRDVLGIAALAYGGFEDAECRLMLELALPGSVAMDVGANVGIHAIPLASRLAPGRLIAVEPLQQNAERLLANALLNDIDNIDLHVVSAGPSPGTVQIHLARDDAFASTGQVLRHWDGEQTASVEQTTLDALWETAGCPAVSLVKIDVEGEEAGVLLGAIRLLSQERPAILAEANTPEELGNVTRILDRYGYQRVPVEGFEPWNHLFLGRTAALSEDAASPGPVGTLPVEAPDAQIDHQVDHPAMREPAHPLNDGSGRRRTHRGRLV